MFDYTRSEDIGSDRFSEAERQAILIEATVAVSNAPKDGFASEIDAAKFLRAALQPIAEQYDIEFGAHIFRDDLAGGVYRVTQPYTSFDAGFVKFRNMLGHASFHTHQSNSQFSGFGGDISFIERSLANGYLSNTEGLLLYRAPAFRYAYKDVMLRKQPLPKRKDYIEWVN